VWAEKENWNDPNRGTSPLGVSSEETKPQKKIDITQADVEHLHFFQAILLMGHKLPGVAYEVTRGKKKKVNTTL